MHKTTIKIDGPKLRELLENTAKASIYEIAEANGFSRNIIANVVKVGYASSTVQGIARLYGIERVEYEVLEFKHESEPLTIAGGQISIDDINKIEGLEEIIKNAVKAAIAEALLNPKTNVTTSGDAELLARFEI